jgi:hypothetical protein
MVDLFKGEWVSRLPPPFDHLRAGDADLFTDPRVAWGLKRFAPLAGQTVLDLGPLECGHSYMAVAAGASRVVAVEGNRSHFMRCLVIKELLGLDPVELCLGDFIEFLRREEQVFDVCLAMGILYHLADPVELIALASERASRLVLWTHYYERARIDRCSPVWRRHFVGPRPAETRGFRHTQHRFAYGLGKRLMGFYGGNATHASWLTREDLFGALEHFGWREIDVGAEDVADPRGPNLLLTAIRDGD